MSVACASIFQVAVPSTPISWSAATVSAPAFVRNWRRMCSRFMPAITSGEGRPTNPTSTPRRCARSIRCFTFYLPRQQQVITYPIAGFDDDLTPGKRRFNFIWYRVADAARLREMNIDANGVQHEYSVPPPLIRKDLIAEMLADAQDILPPPLLDAVIKIKQPFITPIYDFTSPAIVFGRVAMVG